MSGILRSVVIRIAVDNARAIAGTKELETQVAKSSRAVQQHSRDWGKVAQGVETASRRTAIGGALALAGAERVIMGFDKQMSAVDAATHESAANLQLLRSAAIKAGADTQYSASEAAQGITELAKAGVSTSDILKGGLAGSLSLAAAGQLGVAESAEIAASAMTQFRLGGDQVNHIADLLAAGAGKAQGSVHDLGMALNQSGLVASQTGLTIEETTGALAAFASAGLVGSDAGTSFKTMLLALNPKSDAAGKLMRTMGFSAYDAHGKFVGLAETAKRLRGAFKDLTPEARNSALMTIFGTDAIRAANILYRQGGRGIDQWINKVNDQGYAAETAARQTNNLSGDIERFTGSLESAFIKSGSGAQKGLRELVQDAEKLVDRFSELPQHVQETAVKSVAIGTALAGALYVVTKLGRGLAGVANFVRGGSRAASAATGIERLAGATRPVPVYIVNGPGGTPIPGGAAGGAAGAAASKRATAATVLRNSLGTVIGAEVASQIQNRITSLGGTGKREAGTFSPFETDNFQTRGFGVGHTIRNDLRRVSSSQRFGGVAAGLDRAIARPLGGDGLTKATDNVKALDKALEKIAFRDQARAAGEWQTALEESGLSADKLAKVLPRAYAAINADGGKGGATETAKGLIQATTAANSYKRVLAGVPKRIRSYVETPGAVRSVSDMLRLRNQYRLTPRQLRTIMQIQGFSATQQRIVLANRLYRQLPKAVRTRVAADTVKSEADVKRLQRRYNLTPRQVRTLMQVSGVDAQIAKVRALQVAIAGVRSKSVTLETVIARRTAGNNIAVRKAVGGQVLAGPGQSVGARDDSIDARLSHREWVQPVNAVDYYGQAFMSDVQNRRFPKPVGYAGGGQVGVATATIPSRGGGAGVGFASLRGITITGTVDGPFGPQQLRGMITDVVAETDDMKGMRERARR